MKRSVKSIIAATAAIFMCAVPTVSSLSFIPEVTSITASANYYPNGFADFADDWTPTMTGVTNFNNINLGHVDYEINTTDKTAKVKGIDRADSKIKIPARLKLNGEYYNITEIKNGAFQNKPGAPLTYINLSAATYLTTIGNEAFRGCASLTSITIPASVTYIGTKAFENSGLETLRLERASAYSYKELVLKDRAFANCKKLTRITNNVTRFDKIAAYGVVEDSSSNTAFDDCNKANITVGTSYRVIGYKEQFVNNFKRTFSNANGSFII